MSQAFREDLAVPPSPLMQRFKFTDRHDDLLEKDDTWPMSRCFAQVLAPFLVDLGLRKDIFAEYSHEIRPVRLLDEMSTTNSLSQTPNEQEIVSRKITCRVRCPNYLKESILNACDPSSSEDWLVKTQKVNWTALVRLMWCLCHNRQAAARPTWVFRLMPSLFAHMHTSFYISPLSTIY